MKKYLLILSFLIPVLALYGLVTKATWMASYDNDVVMNPLTALMVISLVIAISAKSVRTKAITAIPVLTLCSLRIYEYMAGLTSNLDNVFTDDVSSIAPTTSAGLVFLALNVLDSDNQIPIWSFAKVLSLSIMAIGVAVVGMAGHFSGHYFYEWHMSINTAICIVLMAIYNIVDSASKPPVLIA